MADFHLWGKIEHIAPSRFMVIVTTVAADGTKATPEIRIAGSRQAAEDLRTAMLLEAGEAVRAHGDRVVDVEAG